MDIKICGLKTEVALRAIIEGGATHAGFIFFEKSPRHIDPQTAAKLSAIARSSNLKAVAVTVDADDLRLDEIVSVMKPDMLQLHGRETPERVDTIRKRYHLPVIKAFSISTAADFKKVGPYRQVTDRFLFDAKPPKGSELPGGNAVSFDWNLLKDLEPGLDYLLAGGLHAGNVVDAIQLANPPGLDISSGVENAPGIKDTSKIRAFFTTVKTYSSS